MNFKEPISIYAYNMISLHHDIIWYIIIIISLVYWVLYKIINEYSWNRFNKYEGLLSNYKWIIKIQIFILFLLFIFFNFIMTKLYNIGIFFINIFDKQLLLVDKGFFFRLNKFLGKHYYTGLYKNVYNTHWNFTQFNKVFIDKYLAYYLFYKASNALYYYDGYDAILKTLQFKHSMNMEYVFGFFPTFIIALIIVPSIYLLYSNETDINPSLTIKVIGHQWYWSYQSTNLYFVTLQNKLLLADYSFDSVIIAENDLIKGAKRLLETDKSLVLPYKTVIRFLITSTDVLHAWSVPELGIKVDAVPGRLNQVLTTANNLGIYYGQCSELCGISHGFMPIKVTIISFNDYFNWMTQSEIDFNI